MLNVEDGEGAGLAHALRAWLQAREGGPVELVETHLSCILLTPQWAYKLKKPVQLPFADFRTVAARRHFCEEELRLNQRLAPALYVAVLPVLGCVQAPRLAEADDPEGAAAAIDWVLRMRRFPAGAELDALVRAGRLEPAEVDAFALQLARFHMQAPVAPEGSEWGGAVQVAQSIHAVFDTLAPLMRAEEGARLAALRAWFERQQGALRAAWGTRRAGGHVRECHGDLHLANVVRLAEGITAFDCIEFSPALRWIDTLADAAFFSMDLHAHGRSDLAWRFWDGYLAATGDYAGLAVLRPYEVYRALVRAMAARLRAAQGGAHAAGPDYLACAEALAAATAPRLLITHGLSGSGKSTVAAALLQHGAIRLRSDVERKRLHGLAPLDRSAGSGLDLYTPAATERTLQHLAQQAGAALQAGYAVVVDATFLRRQDRDAFCALARRLRVPFTILHCHAPAAQLRDRLTHRQAAGTDPSEADGDVLVRQERSAEPLAPQERACALEVPTHKAWDAALLYRRWQAASRSPSS